MNVELTATDAGEQPFAAAEKSFQEDGFPARAACCRLDVHWQDFLVTAGPAPFAIPHSALRLPPSALQTLRT